MIKIYDSILDIQDNFDAFIFDIQGVLWNGHNFYENIKETLERLTKNNKIVFILSNSARFYKGLSNTYLKLNFLKNIHYNEFITSGDFTKEILLKKELQFKNNKNPKNCYIFGEKDPSLFEGTDYCVVNDIDKADFVYISKNIVLDDSVYNSISNDMKKYFVRLLNENNVWRITSLEPIIPELEKLIVKNNLPILVNNPDLFAMNNIVGYDKPIPTITPGSVGKYLKEKGLEVVEFGKPYKEIFEYAILKIQKYKNIDKSRICMVGDTLRTDIKGANNTGIKSVLCLETGITKNEIDNGAELDDLIKNEGVVVDYLIKSVSGNF